MEAKYAETILWVVSSLSYELASCKIDAGTYTFYNPCLSLDHWTVGCTATTPRTTRQTASEPRVLLVHTHLDLFATPVVAANANVTARLQETT